MSHFASANGDSNFSPAELEDFLRDSFEREFSDIEKPQVKFIELNSAFGRRIREFKFVNIGYKHIEEFLTSLFKKYREQVINSINEHGLIKSVCYFSAEFERGFKNDEKSDILLEKRTVYIPTKMKPLSLNTDWEAHFQNDIIDYVRQKVEDVMVEGSGFTLSRIDSLTVQIFKHEPFRGAGYIELPKSIKGKRSIVNIQNNDNKCFKWAILAALHYDEVHGKNKNKGNFPSNYDLWADELNFDGIEFPMRLNQIEKFMKQNDGIAVNVYHFSTEKQRLCPLFLASKPIEYRYVHLLLLTEQKAFDKNSQHMIINSHYCWIKNLAAVVHSQITLNTRKISLCDRCLNYFPCNKKLEMHKTICNTMNECAIEMPKPGENYEQFKNHKNAIRLPFIIYADTETLMKQPEAPVFNPDCSTQAHHEHQAHSIGYYFKSEVEEVSSRYASNRGPNCLDWFMDELTEIAEEAFDILTDKKPMNPLTKEEEVAFLQSTNCHICKKSFSNASQDKQSSVRVKDHCHLTGNYRGAAHQSCNLQYQISRTIPVVFHNLSGYDSHLLIRKLGSCKRIPGEITVVPHNSENYISFIKTMRGVGMEQSVIKFKFIDSLRFMTASLDYLSSIIPPEKKQILKTECEKNGYSDEQFNLLKQKGVFPYEYINSYKTLEEDRLPPRKCFYSSLTDSNISHEQYDRAQNVWQKFNLRTIGEYSDLYLQTDVLLLADVFENFRSTCYKSYSLDPAHYFGAAGLSFDAMLKYTGVSIELFTDIDMLMFAERGIRGGISQINKRYAKANNIYTGFDSSKESSYLIYLDGKHIYFIFISHFFSIYSK